MAKTKAKPKTKASSRAKKAAPSTAKKQAKPAKAAVKPRPGTKDASKKAAKSTKKPPAAAPKANPKTKLKTTMKKTTQGPAKAAPKKAPEPKERQEAPAPATNAVSRGKNASLDREFLIKLAQAIREVVQPAIDASKGREVIGNAPSGDATFQLDRLAEKALLTFLRDAKLPVAYYSEDSGYTTFTSG